MGVEQFVIEQGVGEALQIFDGGVAATGGRSAIGQSVGIGVPGVAAHFGVADGTLRNILIFRQRIGGSHSGGRKNMFANVIVVILAADFLNDYAEQQKTVVAVFPLAARVEGQAACAVEFDVILQSLKFETMLIEFRAEEIAGATGVGEQMVDGNFCGDVFIRIVGKNFAQGGGELEFSGLHQLQRRNGGEHFVHGADAEASV